MARQPKRQKKTDRLLQPSASKNEQICDMAVAPFDAEVRRLNLKWGVDRIEELVPVELAERYGAALAHLNEAMRDSDPDRVREAANNCIRGLRKLDEVAEASGASKANPNVLEVDVDGEIFGILLDDKSWPAAQAVRPNMTLLTRREVAIAIRFYKNDLLKSVKENFPDAEVVEIRPLKSKLTEDFFEKGGDEIPF